MRPLEDLQGERLRFRATVKEVESGKTHIRFTNIIRTDTNEVACEYLRNRLSKNMLKLDLKEGDVVEFDARVKMCIPFGHVIKTIRYKLYRFTNCEKITNTEA